MKKFDNFSIIVILAFVGLDIFLWQQILFAQPLKNAEVYFLDVGQGDAELLVLPHNIKILTDAGPDKKIVTSLEKILAQGDRYIDLVIISHPQLDHFNGLNFLLDRYEVGAIITNGRSDSPGVVEWKILTDKIRSKNIPLLTMKGGDAIRYEDNKIDFLSPNADYLQSAELNDTGIVEEIKTPKFKILFAADTGQNIENFLLDRKYDLRADVLKVSHHGSKYSSGDDFLRAVNPKVAVIEVGARNRYGHPAQETLLRLASSTHARIFRTDQDGTVKIFAEKGLLKVFTHP
jgi:beta-lactamase superfamily II metal-dependent hydrolase